MSLARYIIDNYFILLKYLQIIEYYILAIVAKRAKEWHYDFLKSETVLHKVGREEEVWAKDFLKSSERKKCLSLIKSSSSFAIFYNFRATCSFQVVK